MTKVLIATDKPFAPVAVKGIREIVEAQGYELALLEKYTSPEELIAAVADVDAMIIRSDKATKEVIDAKLAGEPEEMPQIYYSRLALIKEFLEAHYGGLEPALLEKLADDWYEELYGESDEELLSEESDEESVEESSEEDEETAENEE